MEEDIYDKFLPLEKRMPNRPEISDEDILIFKRVFESDDGQQVLCMICDMCKFMDQCDNEREMALNNFAKKLITIVHWDIERNSMNLHFIIEFIKNKLKKRSKK